MALQWRRPGPGPAGRVWSTFRGRPRAGERPLTYEIRDMEDSGRKQCLDMMQEVFLRDEPLCQILDISQDPESVATIRSNWERYADQGVCVACYSEEGELVAVNILLVRSRGDEEEDIEKVRGKPWRKLLQTLTAAEELVDVFQLFDVDHYLSSSGLTVARHHRGQNIGARLIEARQAICAAYNLRAACTVFTARASQALAAKCGYRALARLPYRDMARRGVDLRGADTEEAVVMGIKYC